MRPVLQIRRKEELGARIKYREKDQEVLVGPRMNCFPILRLKTKSIQTRGVTLREDFDLRPHLNRNVSGIKDGYNAKSNGAHDGL